FQALIRYCHLPPQTGPCKALLRYFFYNSVSRSREPFVYGGCLGNRDTFQTQAECVRRCTRSLPTQNSQSTQRDGR
uniref:BPTI/Kunitz inhibitor domain-containing protein n=1 Tax=Ornithorhynchus anatinus TaxID=9258 RepID=A0A6I8MXG5_ORNAN